MPFIMVSSFLSSFNSRCTAEIHIIIKLYVLHYMSHIKCGMFQAFLYLIVTNPRMKIGISLLHLMAKPMHCFYIDENVDWKLKMLIRRKSPVSLKINLFQSRSRSHIAVPIYHFFHCYPTLRISILLHCQECPNHPDCILPWQALRI